MSFDGDFCPRGVCDGSGWILDEETDMARPCECREIRINRAASYRIGTGIPRRFRTMSLDSNPIRDFPKEVLRQVRDFVADIDRNLELGRGFWFYGDVGTGKTSLAMVISRAAVEAGKSVAIYSTPQLLADIRATYEDGAGRSYLDLFRRLSNVDLLHLDDLGAERTTEWVLEQLYAIVNERWQEQRSMLVTTNLTDRDRLREQIGERTVSRLSEMCATIPIMGDDLRRPVPDWEQRARAESR